jgi:rubrerythrin
MTVSLKTTISQLEELFEVLNEVFFANSLASPVVTISPDTTKGAYGWCTSYKAWSDKESGEGYYEINICAEYLARTIEEVAETMLHEMVHLFNLQEGVKDTSRGGTYHNNKFKDAAEAHGLTVEKDEKYGWCKTALNPEAREEVEYFADMINKKSFDLFRQPEGEKEKKGGKSSSRKYVCPVCGAIIRATKEVKVICADCDVMFELQE